MGMTDVQKVEAFIGCTDMTTEDIMKSMIRRGYYTSIALNRIDKRPAYWTAWVMKNQEDYKPAAMCLRGDAKKALCRAIVMCDGIIPKGETK